MKPFIFAGAMIFGTLLATGTACLADVRYWVVGNRATNRCDIVTSNPIIIGSIWFGDGPYKSLGDAKLARSTINVCPKDVPAPR